MIKVLVPLPKKLTIAFSGGVDSVAITDFLSKKHDVTCAYFNHNTENGHKALAFVKLFCESRNLPLVTGELYRDKHKDESMEEYWRNQRYQFLNDFENVITCHHLDDCVETYLWGCMHGSIKTIPVYNKNIVRPFLTTNKQTLIDWCVNKNIPWYHDTSNDDTKYTRNYIRHELLPHALRVNPGLYKVVKKLVENNL